MFNYKKSVGTLKRFAVSFPVCCVVFYVLFAIFFYTKTTMKFNDDAVCLQPHFVMTGRISRLIKYAIFHHGVASLLLSVVMMALIGSTAEKQLGTLRFCYTFLVLIVLTGLIITAVSILLAFTTQFSSLPYDCPGLGNSAPMLAMFVVVCRNLKMKKVWFLCCLLNKNLLPFVLALLLQAVVPGSFLFPNLCGCIAGNLYLVWFSNTQCLPASLLKKIDGFLDKTFAYTPFPVYYKLTSNNYNLLPTTTNDITLQQPSQMYQKNEDASKHDHQVPPYKVTKMVQMGFSREESEVSLAATGGSIEQSVQLLSEARVAQDANVVAS